MYLTSPFILQTAKLDPLPSISEVERPSEDPYYNNHNHTLQRSVYPPLERLHPLPLPQPPQQQTYSSGTSSPRHGYQTPSILNGSAHTPASSYTTPIFSNGAKTPSPTIIGIPAPTQQQSPYSAPPANVAYQYSQDSYTNMNQTPPQDLYYSSQNTSGAQQQSPQTVSAGTVSHYSNQQPRPLLHPGLGSYQPLPYPEQGYSNALVPFGYQHAGPVGQYAPMPIDFQGALLRLPMPTNDFPASGFDPTGQHQPPGMKPRVTATLWEDEGSVCFQVEANGICVARREDNAMINGTKLLNVAGMTRGRRDGILKSEKIRHVVKIGPMHLKGVWIPYERALEFANKEKITNLLYPLFLRSIEHLLFHPLNMNRNHVILAAKKAAQANNHRKQIEMRNNALPSSQEHHHHSILPGTQQSLALVPSRNLDRSNTFPTPPKSSSSVLGPMEGPNGHFQWNGQNSAIDTGMSNAHQMPTTPMASPSGALVRYQPPPRGQYENSRPMYSTQSSYGGRYGQADSYVKNEMGPPRTPGPVSECHQQHDSKPSSGMFGRGPSEEEGDNEHDAEYTHDTNHPYDSSRGAYGYAPTTSVGSLPPEHAHLGQDMSGSPGHQGASGRATPRTTAVSQPGYYQHGNYSPPRGPPSSNLFSTLSRERATAGDRGPVGGELYASGNELGAPLPNGYSSGLPSMNGGSKRRRDDDEDGARPLSRGASTPGEIDARKRRKIHHTDGSRRQAFGAQL